MDNRIAVPVSGTGSLLEAMVKNGLPIALVLADRPCRGIDVVAVDAKLPAKLVARSPFGSGKGFDRDNYTLLVASILKKHGIDVVAMAGFMTFFSPHIFRDYGGRILNIHPSLLPSFKGEHAVRDALAFGVKVTGTTVHLATSELDNRPIIAQEPVRVLDGDTEETLHERIKQVERVLYPATIRAFAARISRLH